MLVVITTPQMLSMRFGNEFQFLNSDSSEFTGFSANELVVLAQKVTGDTKPDPSILG